MHSFVAAGSKRRAHTHSFVAAGSKPRVHTYSFVAAGSSDPAGGGTVTAGNAPDGGAIFEFVLPGSSPGV
jgi:hypothetical protein